MPNLHYTPHRLRINPTNKHQVGTARLLATIGVAALVAGCQPTSIEMDSWACNDDEECTKGYRCNTVKHSCEKAEEFCIDADSDGYGVGDGCIAADCNDSAECVSIIQCVNFCDDEICREACRQGRAQESLDLFDAVLDCIIDACA